MRLLAATLLFLTVPVQILGFLWQSISMSFLVGKTLFMLHTPVIAVKGPSNSEVTEEEQEPEDEQ